MTIAPNLGLAQPLTPAAWPDGVTATGTGLDTLITAALNDTGLDAGTSDAQMAEGLAAMAEMNALLIRAIKETGIANNGQFTVGDMKVLAQHLNATAGEAWARAFGTSDGGETGFHQVLWDGGRLQMMGNGAIDAIARGIYQLGFGHDDWRTAPGTARWGTELSDVAHYLSTLLAEDIASGALDSDVDLYGVTLTGTGLDMLTEAILNDPRLEVKFATDDLVAVAEDVSGLNDIILQAITATGAANDGHLSAVDIIDISTWIADNRAEDWAALNGDDSSGFRAVLWEGATIMMGGTPAVDGLARALYSMGNDIIGSSLRDANGHHVARLDAVAEGLSVLLDDTLKAGRLVNPDLLPGDPAEVEDALVLDIDRAVSILDKDGEVELPHSSDLALTQGTIALTFSAEQPEARTTQALFSKDFSGDNAGDLTVYVRSGELFVQFVGDEGKTWVRVPGQIEAHTAYDLALTFDGAAMGIYLDGHKVASLPAAGFDLAANAHDLAIGAATWHRTADKPTKLNSYFQGEILDVEVYDRALDRGEVASISQGVTRKGTDGDDDLAGTDARDVLDGGMGHDILLAGDGNDAVYGGYGADVVDGGDGDDVVMGGHGQDLIRGGDGNDILISRADGREQKIAQLFDEDGPNGIPEDEGGFANGGATGSCPMTGGPVCYCGRRSEEVDPDDDENGDIDPETGKLYPDQPIAADDTLEGGAGADIFRFQTVINAKYDIILKHVRADGSINWAGVAGENNNYHDHWVDYLGEETILDFNREEGDKIEIAGHTTRIASVTYEDLDNDGVDESSKIWLISDQGGNGGAHDQDYLGSITVIGTIIVEDDVSVDAGPTYGIVETVADIDEAITPLDASDATPRDIPEDLAPTEATGPRGPVPGTLPEGIAPTIAAADAIRKTGNGLVGQAYDTDYDWRSVTELQEDLDEGLAATHSFTTGTINWSGQMLQSIGDFLTGAEITEGDTSAAVERMAIKLTGYLWLDAGDHRITVNSDDGFALYLGGQEVIVYQSPRPEGATSVAGSFEGGLYEVTLLYYENRGSQALRMQVDGEYVSAADLFTDLDAFEVAAEYMGPAIAAAPSHTGLDLVLDWLDTDSGLDRRADPGQIDAAKQAASTMNALLVEAIEATGAADGGRISTAELYDISDWLVENRSEAWAAAYGTDDAGWKPILRKGAETYVLGDKAINQVADDMYSLGFGTSGDRVLNHAGKRDQRLEKIAYSLNSLLAADLEGGRFDTSNAVAPEARSGTGLDILAEIAMADDTLGVRLSESQMIEATEAMSAMSTAITEAIHDLGYANDGSLSRAEVRGLSSHLQETYGDSWHEMFGQDLGEAETGFELVRREGASTKLDDRWAIDHVADIVFSLGFGWSGWHILGANGKGRAGVNHATDLLNGLLADDMEALENPVVDPIDGTTGTGLDQIVALIGADDRLHERLSMAQIEAAAERADMLNAMILEGIQAQGLADDGSLGDIDVRDLAEHLRLTHGETWRDLVTDGDLGVAMQATSQLLGYRATRDIGEALYNLGFGVHSWGRIKKANGGSDFHARTVADWLNALLGDALTDGSLNGPASSGPEGDPILRLEDLRFDGVADALQIEMAGLAAGTVVTRFEVETSHGGRQTLWSMGQGDDATGDMRLVVNNGRLELWSDTGMRDIRLHSGDVTLVEGQEYTATVGFDENGMDLSLNGVKLALLTGTPVSWAMATPVLTLGARNAASESMRDGFNGDLLGLQFYDERLTNPEANALNLSGDLPEPGPGDAALVLEDLGGVEGDGLSGVLSDFNRGSIKSVAQFLDRVEEGADYQEAFTARSLDYAGGTTVAEFLGEDAEAGMEAQGANTFGLTLDGFIFVEAGRHKFEITTDDGFSLQIGGETVAEFAGLRAPRTTTVELEFLESGLYAFDLAYFENWGQQEMRIKMDGNSIDQSHLFSGIEDFLA